MTHRVPARAARCGGNPFRRRPDHNRASGRRRVNERAEIEVLRREKQYVALLPPATNLEHSERGGAISSISP